MDIFTIDDGWQQEYGENTVDPTAFPGGLDPYEQPWKPKACVWDYGFPWRPSGLRPRIM